jgi:transposase
MARRTFVVVDSTEIYVHWYTGRSKSALAASLGVDRKTVRKYLAPAEASGITPGGPPMSEADWARPVEGWFPGLTYNRLRQVTWPDIDEHRDYIADLLGTVTVSTIHQLLRDEHKLKVSISSFRRWVHATLPDEVSRVQVTVPRDEIEPGEEAQIDYGFVGQWTNPRTGKRHGSGRSGILDTDYATWARGVAVVSSAVS